MPHSDEASLITYLEDNFSNEVVEEFKNCINYAKYWRQYESFQQGSGDAFSNVLNNTGCNAKLTEWFSYDQNLLIRAKNCLNYYHQSNKK